MFARRDLGVPSGCWACQEALLFQTKKQITLNEKRLFLSVYTWEHEQVFYIGRQTTSEGLQGRTHFQNVVVNHKPNNSVYSKARTYKKRTNRLCFYYKLAYKFCTYLRMLRLPFGEIAFEKRQWGKCWRYYFQAIMNY